MKRIVIICEGETEQEFCNKLLFPYFFTKGLLVDAPLIKRSNGGIVGWEAIKRQIVTTLAKEREACVTLMIDYYGLYARHAFPGWAESERIADKNERLSYIEYRMSQDVPDDIRFRFIPYIQLHEFEGLLFCNVDAFAALIPSNDLIGLDELTQVITDNPNPEMINTGRETSPSHRLQRIIRGYNKILHGYLLAETIGLPVIRQKCPRFDGWMCKIEQLAI